MLQSQQAQQQLSSQLQEASGQLEALREELESASAHAKEAGVEAQAAKQAAASAQLRLQDVEAEKRLAQEQVGFCRMEPACMACKAC